MNAIRTAIHHVTDGVGRCPACMRTSFKAAAAAWVIGAVGWIAADEPIVRFLIGLAVVGFTTLWLTHMLTFAARAVWSKKRTIDRAARAGALSRRQLLPTFGRALTVAAAVTTLPAATVVALMESGRLARADEFGCDYNTCDASHPCNRGCKCVYNSGSSVGYCDVWYRH